MNVFCKRLKDARTARLITQDELAEQADISRVMVSRYETGAVTPTVDVLVRLANALSVSVDYLLGRDEYALSPSSEKTSTPLFEQSDLLQNCSELKKFILDVLKEQLFSDNT